MIMVQAQPISTSESTFDAPVIDESIFESESWDLFSCWKQQQADRFGGGSTAPSIPRSQRQYDGDNPVENCEVWWR